MIRAATADDPLRIAVLASGRGSNLAALMERLDPSVVIVAVASNRADAVALSMAFQFLTLMPVFIVGLSLSLSIVYPM
jgi:hypothetical protein